MKKLAQGFNTAAQDSNQGSRVRSSTPEPLRSRLQLDLRRTTTDRLEIAVDDAFLLEEFEALEEGIGEPADEGDTEALEVILLDQLIQVHPVNKHDNCRQTINKTLQQRHSD